jgi:hypothetical protein
MSWEEDNDSDVNHGDVDDGSWVYEDAAEPCVNATDPDIADDIVPVIAPDIEIASDTAPDIVPDIAPDVVPDIVPDIAPDIDIASDTAELDAIIAALAAPDDALGRMQYVTNIEVHE